MHNFTKRSICFFLMLALAVGLLPLSAAADTASAAYTGDTLVAVNTVLSTGSKTNGSFTAESSTYALRSLQSAASADGGHVFDVYLDSETGDELTVISPELPELIEASDEICAAASLLPEADLSEYAVDDTFSLRSLDGSVGSMECLYVGTYCTVWGSTSDDAAVCLNAEQAQQIGENFDLHFPDITDAFGSYWYDADADGRVAIMCYDIDHDYGTSVSTYTAGYFYSVDMLGFDNRLNGIYFGNTPTNAIDCIHIDTYPLMGYGTPLENIEDCYGTLVHEFQHMLNFSSCIENGTTLYPTMPSYLNEAFSMAAEHLICGPQSTSGRVSYFNDSYTPGTALTYWSGTLSNYSNSYLFGQYIRTRYGALCGDDGSSVYKTVMQLRQESPSADCLTLLADLLGTSEQQLVIDFWCACYLKEDSGNYGFGGESWADAISPYVSSAVSSASEIYNGGAKFYDLSSGFTPASSSNVTFVALTDPDDPDTQPPVLTDLTATRLSVSEATITFTPDKTGTLYCSLTTGTITDKSSLSNAFSITAGKPVTLGVSTLSYAAQSPTFYYYTVSGSVQSELLSIKVPALACTLTVEQPKGGTVTCSPAEPLAGDTVSLSVELDSYYQLRHYLVDGEPIEGDSFVVTGDHTVSAVLTYHNYFALLSDSTANSAEFFLHSPYKGTAYLVLYDTASGRMLELQEFALSGTESLWQYITTEHDLLSSTVRIFLVDENGAPMSDVVVPPVV